ALASGDVDVRITAARVLGAAGPDAVPALVQALRDDDDPRVRLNAATALGRRDMNAKAAIPALVAALKDDRAVGGAAAEALRAWGPDAVGPLLGVMKDKDHPLAGGLALQALINMGPQAKAAVPALIRDMKAG